MKARGDLDQRTDSANDAEWPRSGRSRRVRTLRAVDLPAPLGPMIPSAWQARLEGDILERPELFWLEWIYIASARQRRYHRRDEIAQAIKTLASIEFLPDAVEGDDRLAGARHTLQSDIRRGETPASQRRVKRTPARSPAGEAAGWANDPARSSTGSHR